jgi:NAD(P)-dependent dehydrogenase (short-subunit alcohol dehydrogenase family)
VRRVVLITGAAGGIGRGCGKVFAEAGWTVIGVDKRPQPGLSKDASRFIKADVSQPDAVAQVVQEVTKHEGRMDALVNNAAVQVCRSLLETTVDEWDLTMATNVRSVFLLVCAAHSFLRDSGGAVVNVSSVHALSTSEGMAAYVASKGALVSLTRVMALEFARDGIRVNAVLPGAVDTEMLRAGLGRGHLKGGETADLITELGSRHAVGRVGRPEEIGRAVLFLADGRESSFITGQTLTVDGGATARLSTECAGFPKP